MRIWKTWLYCLSFVTLISTVTIMKIMLSSPNSFQNVNLEELKIQASKEKISTIFKEEFKNPTSTMKISSPKVILIWTKFWGDQKGAWSKIFNLLINKKCPNSNCKITFREKYRKDNDEENADAILFQTMDLYPLFELPAKHRINQPWIAFSVEAPSVMKGGDDRANHLKKLNNVFNWTMSYRRNSDIVVPYGQFIPREEPLQIEGKNFWKEKISNGSLGTWMVSHCSTESRRELFIKELQTYIEVDIYGKCGNLTCGSKLSISTVKQTNLNKCNKIIRNHYFYFAFENSICNDYVTEKFYLALSLDVIPVVFGGADYSSLAPPHSYIDALEFETPKELAEYLSKLAANETAYNKYFEWQRHFTVQLGHPFTPLICDLCSKLFGQPPTTFHIKYPMYFEGSMTSADQSLQGFYGIKVKNSYEDLHSWFIDGSECKSWNPDTKDLQKVGEN